MQIYDVFFFLSGLLHLFMMATVFICHLLYENLEYSSLNEVYVLPAQRYNYTTKPEIV